MEAVTRLVQHDADDLVSPAAAGDEFAFRHIIAAQPSSRSLPFHRVHLVEAPRFMGARMLALCHSALHEVLISTLSRGAG